MIFEYNKKYYGNLKELIKYLKANDPELAKRVQEHFDLDSDDDGSIECFPSPETIWHIQNC